MPKSAQKPTSTSKRKFRPFLWLWVIALITLPSAIVYVTHLDNEVQAKFTGKRWSIPSRVYGRALELYPQRPLSVVELKNELEIAGYQPSTDGLGLDSYHQSGNRFTITTRAFHHWDGQEPAHSIDVTLEDHHVEAISDALSHEEINLIRLKPAEIGTIRPAHQEDRILIKFDELPESLHQALVAIEDRKFYQHPGIDLYGIARAGWANLRAGRVVQGGSTLTQQLVKNFFLNSERTLSRKVNEAIMSLLLEWRYDKQQILEAYANEIYLGQDGNRAIHGFGLAAQFYFNKPVDQLTLAESALLVAIVRGPTYYDPRRHPDRAIERRNRVINELYKDGLINEAEAASATASPLNITAKARKGSTPYPAFIGLVKRQLASDYREQDLRSEGLRIFTTLDPNVQQRTEQAIKQQLKRLQPGRAELESAVVVSRLGSAEVTAMVGSSDVNYWGFNRALEMRRPVGSLLKPAIYLTALEHTPPYTWASLIDDEQITLPQSDGSVWSPANYDHISHGTVPLITALAHSYNQAAVKLGMDLGLKSVAETLQQLGIEEYIPPYPSVMLGSLELSPLAVAQMYQTLADRGYYTPLRAVREVLTAQHQPLQRYGLDTERRFSAESTYLLNQGLHQALRNGTGKRVAQQLPTELSLAGKTGTTDQLRDSWFAGFGSEYLAVVWLGNDENQVINLTGSTGALPIWADIMKQIEGKLPPLPPPSDIIHREIEAQSGLLADAGCENRFDIAFIEGSEPSEAAPCASSPSWKILDRIKGWFQ